MIRLDDQLAGPDNWCNRQKHLDFGQNFRNPARRVINLTVPGETAVYPAISGAMGRH